MRLEFLNQPIIQAGLARGLLMRRTPQVRPAAVPSRRLFLPKAVEHRRQLLAMTRRAIIGMARVFIIAAHPAWRNLQTASGAR